MTFFYAPATDTTEIPSLYRGNPPTTEIPAPWLRPALPARPRRRWWARLVTRRDLAQAWDSACVVVGGLALAAAVLAALQATHDLGALLYTVSLGANL